MKYCKNILSVLLAILLTCSVMLFAFAEDWDDDDPYTDDPETDVTQVIAPPDTTAPHGSLTRESTTKATTTAAPKTVDPPLVKITREDIARKPKGGETFTVTVLFHNYSGDVSLRSGLASFEPSEGLVLVENSASKVVPVIGPSGVRSVQIKLRANKDAAASQSVSVSYAYSYNTPDGLVQAEASEKLLLAVTPLPEEEQTEKSAAAANATPNIIVTSYNYGGTIAAGDAFTLSLQFTNTSKKIAAENIVMSVETGEGITITSASNTYYYSTLGAGKSLSQQIPMRVAANANPEGAKIDLSFRYEYVDGSSRSDTSTNERLSIPIYIPDRFSVTAPDTQVIGLQNEEISLSLPYVNKSKSEVSNVEAELVYDDAVIFCEQPHINLGNFEPGRSGTIDFFFVPSEAGDGTVTVRIKYEDELTQEKNLEIRVPYSADPMIDDYGYTEEPTDFADENSAGHSWIWIVCGIGAVIVIFVIVLVAFKMKKKKTKNAIEFDWDTPQEVSSHEDN